MDSASVDSSFSGYYSPAPNLAIISPPRAFVRQHANSHEGRVFKFPPYSSAWFVTWALLTHAMSRLRLKEAVPGQSKTI